MSKEGILAPPAGIEFARIHRKSQCVISGKPKIPHTIPQGRNWGMGATPDTSKIAFLYLEIVNQCLRRFKRTTDQMADLDPYETVANGGYQAMNFHWAPGGCGADGVVERSRRIFFQVGTECLKSTASPSHVKKRPASSSTTNRRSSR